MSDMVLERMSERYNEIIHATGLDGKRTTITYQLGFNRNGFVLRRFSHYWGGNAEYEDLATFYSTMSDKQIIDAIKVIMGVKNE